MLLKTSVSGMEEAPMLGGNLKLDEVNAALTKHIYTDIHMHTHVHTHAHSCSLSREVDHICPVCFFKKWGGRIS